MENKFIDRISSIDDSHKYSMHSDEEILLWFEERKKQTDVTLKRITLEECTPWYYDDKAGCIRNVSDSFFRITGLNCYKGGELLYSQPIIEQYEIGYLGILCCKINNVWHYLMQAKIEPGNVNVVQLSPTLQATKSNFTRKHGGAEPAFLKYFTNMNTDDIIVDQIQSEQSSRFLRKRNRNVIRVVHSVLPETETHKWMTLSQIKKLMHIDNMVNMDTRTVLSCIPYVLMGEEGDVPFKDTLYFYRSAWNLNRKTLVNIYNNINDVKMFEDYRIEKTDLYSLNGWKMDKGEFISEHYSPFKVIFCDIHIEGREVTNWKQPLLAATEMAMFGLICTDDNGMLKFLTKTRFEVGCFDTIEIGPTIQREGGSMQPLDCIEELFYEEVAKGKNIIADVILSEEGGRFYQEENRNVIIYVDKDKIEHLPRGYVWSDYGTLNMLTQVNNCLNIQLRNLLSLIGN